MISQETIMADLESLSASSLQSVANCVQQMR